MRSDRHSSRQPLVDRIARVAFAFLLMNCAAVAGLISAITRRKVWR